VKHKSRKDPSLPKIILVLIVLLGAAFGIYRVSQWFVSGESVARVEATAQEDIETARGYLADGRTEEARQLLDPIAEKSKSGELAAPALMLLAKLDLKDGDRDSARLRLERAASAFPGSPEQPRAAAAYANFLEEDGQVEQAVRIFEEIRANASSHYRAPALTGLGRHAARQGNLMEARELFEEALQSARWNTDDWDEALDEMGNANVELIFSTTPTPDSKVYTVESGDTFTSIGIKLNTTLGLLTRANNLGTDATLRVGQNLKWTPKDFRIVIERSTCRLFLMDSDGIFKRYTAGLGMPGHETTLGKYKIGNKIKDPTWHKPGEGPIPPGDPRNELGTRWMPFVPEQEGLPSDLGIHGTIDPSTVGKYSSHGCARLRMDEVEELFDLVVRSTPVEVVETIEPETIGSLAIARL
jgi:lipoprotein-anchoring transpeptidase ErfK/SrfK/Tfp pilus assembly protein PilF